MIKWKSIIARILVGILVSRTVFAPGIAAAYDLSHSISKKASASPFSVALVPFAEMRTRSLDDLMGQLRSELGRTKGVRMMDQADTEEILRYYLKYVNA